MIASKRDAIVADFDLGRACPNARRKGVGACDGFQPFEAHGQGQTSRRTHVELSPLRKQAFRPTTTAPFPEHKPQKLTPTPIDLKNPHGNPQTPLNKPSTTQQFSRRGITHSRDLSGMGTARAENDQGTPTQSHISPSILVCEKKPKREAGRGRRGLCTWSERALY